MPVAYRSPTGTQSIKTNCASPGGDGNPLPTFNVYNNLTDSCLHAALITMLNASNLNNKISGILTDVFGSSDKVNLSFQNYTNANDKPAKTESPYYYNNTFNVTIDLNTSKLEGCSQEFATITMVHEVLHGFMDYNGQYKTQLQQHQQIAEKYVEDIKSYVQQLYPINDQDAYAIILNGLSDVYGNSPLTFMNALKTKYNVDDPLGTYELERVGLQGTKCK